jgi:flavin-dependent dehydrogenase
MIRDVLIVGAGPSGATAATLLARKGLRVTMADGVDPARHKIGEHLPGAAMRLVRKLQLGLLHSPHLRVGGTLSSWGSEALMATDSICDPQGPGLLLDRAAFDADLRAGAIRAGAEFRGSDLASLDRTTVWHAVLKDGSAVSAQWLIDATGRRSAAARRLGANYRRDARVAAVYWIGSSDRPRLDRIMIEARPNGWWYAADIPTGKHVAGFHGLAKDVAELASSSDVWLQALAETRHISARFSPASFDRRLQPVEASGACLSRFSGEGWLACGDAAIAFDPISGQGMYFAIHSGSLASACVADAFDGGTDTIAEYADRLHHVRLSYFRSYREAYRTECRWSSAPFWSELTNSGHVTPDRAA